MSDVRIHEHTKLQSLLCLFTESKIGEKKPDCFQLCYPDGNMH